jgi:hypothetical protein
MTELYALVRIICIDITETSVRLYHLRHFSKDVNETEICNLQKLFVNSKFYFLLRNVGEICVNMMSPLTVFRT